MLSAVEGTDERLPLLTVRDGFLREAEEDRLFNRAFSSFELMAEPSLSQEEQREG